MGCCMPLRRYIIRPEPRKRGCQGNYGGVSWDQLLLPQNPKEPKIASPWSLQEGLGR